MWSDDPDFDRVKENLCSASGDVQLDITSKTKKPM